MELFGYKLNKRVSEWKISKKYFISSVEQFKELNKPAQSAN